MATYVNDLRLKEIGTGESSGTWGSETNTNLELIAEAFSFGTEAITTNADTHTTTIADGSTDPGRSIYLKYTGTLDSACTITIGPNTVSKLWFIENGTSGSQNIIISQGSGANVTIPAGDVKAVYSDGAGSGAAIVDAFASLNVVDLKVEDDLTVTDDASIGGDATITGTLGVTGAVTANAGVSIDNITIDGTEIDLSSGDLTIDVAGDIILDADGSTISMKDGGTNRITFNLDATPDLVMAGGNASITASTSDADFTIIGNDGGSDINALTFDMSDAGTATFNHDVKLGDNSKAVFGAGDDLQIYHDETNSRISDLGTGRLLLETNGDSIRLTKGTTENMAIFTPDGSVELYHNNSAKFETTSTGANVTGALTEDSNRVATNGRAIAFSLLF